jgi:hypothetical protein
VSTLHETACPRLKSNPTPKELADIYTPTSAELRLAARLAPRSPSASLAVFVHLKTFQRLGYFTQLKHAPAPIPAHTTGSAHRAGFDRTTCALRPLRHQAPAPREAACRSAGRILGAAGRTWLATVAENAAHTKHLAPDIINVMLEEP